EGTPCIGPPMSMTVCAPGLFCAGADFVCTAPTSAGAPCRGVDELLCPYGYVCAAPAPGADTICRRPTIVTTEGGGCSITTSFHEFVCDSSLGVVCGTDEICHHSSGATGELCDELVHCAAPNVCAYHWRMSRSTCDLPLPSGGDCDLDLACASLKCHCGACIP